MFNQVIQGDCLIKLKELEDNSVDSIVTDPPYELGFMGKSWDNTGIANNVEMWKECLRVLKPGGHLLAFSGTRTYHRMASAIEDAGFEVRDMIEWVYGSGFPKSLNIGKVVDKLQGNEREDLGESENNRDRSKHEYNSVGNVGSNARITKGTSEWEGWGTALKPAHEPICMARKPLAEKTVAENVLKYGTGGINIDESRVYTEYYLQGNDLSDIITICQLNNLQLPANSAELKRFQDDTTNVIKSLFSVAENADMPILEKTLGKVQEDITKKVTQYSEEMLMESINTNLNTFISGKNITEQSLKDLKYIILTVLKMITDWKIYNVSAYQLTEVLLIKAKNEVNTREKSGRFPANLCHDGSDEVKECFPETGSVKGRQTQYSESDFAGDGGWKGEGIGQRTYDGSGNASRFFKNIPLSQKDLWIPEILRQPGFILEDGTPIVQKINGELVYKTGGDSVEIGTKDSEKSFGFSELQNPKSIIYQAKASKSERNKGCEEMEAKVFSDRNPELDSADMPQNRSGNAKQNFHPTVKPIALMTYLIKMVTPKGGIVLDPFAGSGSTLVAAKNNGYQYIGIEMTEEYIPIIEARLK